MLFKYFLGFSILSQFASRVQNATSIDLLDLDGAQFISNKQISDIRKEISKAFPYAISVDIWYFRKFSNIIGRKNGDPYGFLMYHQEKNIYYKNRLGYMLLRNLTYFKILEFPIVNNLFYKLQILSNSFFTKKVTKNICYIYNLLIFEKYRGQKLSRGFLSESINYLFKKYKIDYIVLHLDTKDKHMNISINLYYSLGFRKGFISPEAPLNLLSPSSIIDFVEINSNISEPFFGTVLKKLYNTNKKIIMKNKICPSGCNEIERIIAHIRMKNINCDCKYSKYLVAYMDRKAFSEYTKNLDKKTSRKFKKKLDQKEVNNFIRFLKSNAHTK